MTRNMIFAFALICIGLGQSAYAQPESEKQQCSDSIVNLVGKRFGISDFSYPREGMYPSAQNGGVITAGACKVWPKNNAITIAAFAFDDEGSENGKSLIVTMVDSLKGKVVASYKAVGLDVAEGGLRIDTARYDLAPGVRAIGLDVTEKSSPNCGDGGAGAARTLYIQNGNQIRPILEGLYMSYWSFVQGGSNCASGDTESVTEDFSYSIGIDNTTTNGYANLLITATSSYSSGDKSMRKPFHYELHYNGKKYPIDGMEKEFWKWRM